MFTVLDPEQLKVLKLNFTTKNLKRIAGENKCLSAFWASVRLFWIWRAMDFEECCTFSIFFFLDLFFFFCFVLLPNKTTPPFLSVSCLR